LDIKINQVAVADDLKKLSRALHKAGEKDLKNDLLSVNRRIANDAAAVARTLTPVRTGYLQRWIRGQATFFRARIAVGTKTKATYGKFVELGIGHAWDKIGPQAMAHKAFARGHAKYIRWLRSGVDKTVTKFNRSR